MEGRTALVTGSGGFIGGHLVAHLVRQGVLVRAFCRYTSRGARGTLDWFDPEVVDATEVVFGDLRDADAVLAATAGTDLVFHLGAHVGIPYSATNPRDVFDTNVTGTVNVAQAARAAGVERIVHVSTSEVYGTAQTLPMDEAHPQAARSPYAASKIAADSVMESWHQAYGLPATVVRPFNTYGPHQSTRAVIPTIVAQALASGTVRLGSLHPRRDLTYVEDTVAGLCAAATAPRALGRTLGLGTGRDWSVGELVDKVADLLGRPLVVEHDELRVRGDGLEVDRLVADPSLAFELTGWRATVGLDEGLERTLDWMRANADRFRDREYAR